MKTKKHLRKTHIARNANKKKSQFVEYQCNYCQNQSLFVATRPHQQKREITKKQQGGLG